MGFSTIAGFMMMFFAMIIIISMLVMVQSNLIETTSAANDENERMAKLMNMRIDIQNITFDNLTTPDTTTMLVKNIGSLKINIEYLDVFIDDILIPREQSNRTITFASGILLGFGDF